MEVFGGSGPAGELHSCILSHQISVIPPLSKQIETHCREMKQALHGALK